MATYLDREKEFELLADELQNRFSTEQIQLRDQETDIMKRKTKLKPEYFLLLCSFLSDSFGEKSLTECGKVIFSFQCRHNYRGIKSAF
ncbi:hypothetical protein ACFOUV_15870 [Oceanobacillus longus]|uniref:Uncharacterized protein n=1 Tax=Oceanobacillus longus TaxID=930120 RepID=A0ABV8H4I3_9BACI